MKLKFKHQQFQEDAAMAVCDVFAGQPKLEPTFRHDMGTTKAIKKDGSQFKYIAKGNSTEVSKSEEEILDLGFNNYKIIIDKTQVINNLQRVQRKYQIEPSSNLIPFIVDTVNEETKKKERKRIDYNLTIEMETGVGKTYTYIKTIYELNERYGYKKFIVIVPSVAIREGVYKSFQITQAHFVEDYHKKIRFFIYDSSRLSELDHFANDGGINVMIINSQAFNARGKDARRIYMKLDAFRSRRPIDVIAKTNPILIIDEPQSTEGKVTKQKLPEFNPLMILRYSATHREDSIYNMVYRLDAMEAYNKQLVKKIAVKGISVSGSTSTEGYLYLEEIILSPNHPPRAKLEFEIKRAEKLSKTKMLVEQGFNLYDKSNGMEEYRGYVVSEVNGDSNTVEFTNGAVLSAGDVIGAVNESQIRRIQVRETIKSHFERERELFYKDIKVLSLFFIDEVAKYRKYDNANNRVDGEYAKIFEEEYNSLLNQWQIKFEEDEYLKYLSNIPVSSTHDGYFSIDKKSNHMINSKAKGKEKKSDDVDAYDLIMKDKEKLLDFKEPVRFIFSHSALREGWDNPNVFQICTLKHSGSDVRKRQEVGRGMRLSVNKFGERMDRNILGENVHKLNVLTVVASESYDSFCKELQTQIAENVADRPVEITESLFENKLMLSIDGIERVFEKRQATKLIHSMIRNGYIDDDNSLTNKYYEDKKAGHILIPEDLQDIEAGIIDILDKVYTPNLLKPENARNDNVTATLKKDELSKKEFKELWKRINGKTAYVVDFETDELIKNSIDSINTYLTVSRINFKIETGTLEKIESKEALKSNLAMKKTSSDMSNLEVQINSSIKYDLIGKIVFETELTRSTVVNILKGINKNVFDLFKINPEEFILKAANLINEQKASIIVEHIEYELLEDKYTTDIFTENASQKGKIGDNAIKADKSIYDYVITDSKIELKFAEELEAHKNQIAVYVKLPNAFYISTPVGKYNPDWAIAFYEGQVKHIYFIAETKGALSSLQLKNIEDAKISCARKHFGEISNGEYIYDVVKDYQSLLNVVMK